MVQLLQIFSNFFLTFGFFLSKCRDQLLSFMQNNWKPAGLFVLLLFIFFTITPPTRDAFVPYYLNKVIMALIGLFALYGFSVHPIKDKNASGFIAHFSKYSLQYYLIHEITSLPCFYMAPLLHLKANVGTVLLYFVLVTITSYIVLRIILLNKWCYKFVGIK